MPNLVPGIVELKQEHVANVGAENFLPLPRNEFQKMIPRSIGSIVKGFKIGVTKWFRYNATDVGAEDLLPLQQQQFVATQLPRTHYS